MKSIVSVIVPIFNVEPYLRQCLESICEQSFEDIQIICVNDGSTDGSLKIIEEFAGKDPRIDVIDKPNAGYGDSMNRGIEIATGVYIAIVEPDDWIHPEMIEKLWRAAQCNDHPDVVKAAYWRVCNPDTDDQQLVPANYLHKIPFIGKPYTLDQNSEILFHHPSIWTAIYRKGFLDENGIRFRPIPGAGWADNPFLMETLVQARSIVYIDEPLYYYREFITSGLSGNLKDPTIISDRWVEMDDIVKRLNVTAPLILEGHYNRGCAYIEMLQVDFPESPEAAKGIRDISKRIDYNFVYNSSKIPQTYKDAYQSSISKFERAFRLLHRAASRKYRQC